MSYTDRFRDAFQKSDNKKNPSTQADLEQLKYKMKNMNRDNKSDVYDRLKVIQSSTGVPKEERKGTKGELGYKIIRHSASAVPLTSDAVHTPRFEMYDTHTLVAKQMPSTNIKSSNSNMVKSRSDQLFQSHQPTVTLKPHYGQNNSANIITETNPKIIRSNTNIPDQNRSMSAVYKSQVKQDPNLHKSLSHRPHNQSQSGYKAQPRQSSATSKQYIIGNTPLYSNYDSLNRSKTKSTTKPIDGGNDKQFAYYSLPRKSKISSQNGSKTRGTTKRISSNNLYIDTGTRISKISPIKIPNTNSAVSALDGAEEGLINFSQTLARAATNSPPIKRRSSSLLHSPNPRISARFATKSTIDEIYTQKNRNDNYEKYKKVANEILKENLALKFGENYLFNKKIQDNSLHSSTSSLSSTSSATDQQHSISSIPPDDIPLDIPNQQFHSQESFHSNELFHPQKIPEISKNELEVEDNTEILEGTVTSDGNHLEVVNNVHLSDVEDDNEDSEEYDLDKEQSSSESFASDSDGDIEQFKKKFVPLHEIERMDDDFALENEMLELPDHQHSQSFRIENTSVGSIVEVFVHKESLQRAKDALNIIPNQGILSIKSKDLIEKKKRRALFDPHILLLDACLEPDYDLVTELVPKISNISRSTIDGITALHNAVCSAEAKLVLFLIQSGANVNASDADGWTPLHCAACCNNKQISKILVENGASLFAVTLSDYEIPSQKCNKTNQEDTQCEEYLFWEQENLGVVNGGIVYSLFEYVPQKSDELSLLPNQILKVIDTNPTGETGWFIAEDISDVVSEPKRGFVAAAYVSSYPLIC